MQIDALPEINTRVPITNQEEDELIEFLCDFLLAKGFKAGNVYNRVFFLVARDGKGDA